MHVLSKKERRPYSLKNLHCMEEWAPVNIPQELGDIGSSGRECISGTEKGARQVGMIADEEQVYNVDRQALM